ncbi:MAG TPA: STAS domain-containing protein [Pseudomonadota bacterium]|nr:STAS domain-containing protein [Pseudomonadota bacterium]
MESSASPSPLAVSPSINLNDPMLRQVVAGAPIILTVYAPDGRILLHVGGGVKALGLTENQLAGASVFDAFAGADDALARIRAALRGEESSNMQDLGQTCWDNWFTPLRDEAGQIVGAMSVSTNVTERERTRQALAQRLHEIEEQNRAIRSMATPIIEVWSGVLVVPVVGQLDPERASLMLERLLDAVGERRARFAILDLTAVEVVDTATAQYIVRMVSSLRLLGAYGLISGIRATVAQTLVGLGVDLGQITTKATLHAALRYCMGSDAPAQGPSPPAASR